MTNITIRFYKDNNTVEIHTVTEEEVFSGTTDERRGELCQPLEITRSTNDCRLLLGSKLITCYDEDEDKKQVFKSYLSYIYNQSFSNPISQNLKELLKESAGERINTFHIRNETSLDSKFIGPSLQTVKFLEERTIHKVGEMGSWSSIASFELKMINETIPIELDPEYILSPIRLNNHDENSLLRDLLCKPRLCIDYFNSLSYFPYLQFKFCELVLEHTNILEELKVYNYMRKFFLLLKGRMKCRGGLRDNRGVIDDILLNFKYLKDPVVQYLIKVTSNHALYSEVCSMDHEKKMKILSKTKFFKKPDNCSKVFKKAADADKHMIMYTLFLTRRTLEIFKPIKELRFICQYHMNNMSYHVPTRVVFTQNST